MRFFSKYLSLLVVAVAVLTWLIPMRYGLPYPRPAGPQFSNAIRTGHSTIIDNNHVNVVLIGDSTLDRSVDEQALSQIIGQPSHVISTPASSTALWYLVLKNAIIEHTRNKPKYVVVMFRNTLLTLPNYHVNGGHVTEIDDYATAHEDYMIQTAYLNFMNPLEIAAERYFPLYGSRARITDTLEYRTRSLLPNLILPCKGDCVDRALTAVFFNIENINPNFSQGSLMTEEARLYTPEAMNFDRQIGRSFLPEIIRLAKENNIQLIFVDSRILTFPDEASEPRQLPVYKQALAAYLQKNGIPLLVYSFDPRIPPQDFADPLHMNPQGKSIFTRILGEDLLALIH